MLSLRSDTKEWRKNLVCYLVELTKKHSLRSMHDKDGRPADFNSLFASEGRQRRCAVVSNSGALMDHLHGTEIDLADTVMRFNDAPTSSHEQLIGHKDDIRFVNELFPSWVSTGRYKPDPRVIYVLVQARMMETKQRSIWKTFAEDHQDLKLYEVEPSFVSNTSALLRKVFGKSLFEGRSEEPTSGAMGMLIALSACAQVDAYGMAMSAIVVDQAERYPYHYFTTNGKQMRGNAGMKVGGHTSFLAEKHLWRLLTEDTNRIDHHEVASIMVPSDCSSTEDYTAILPEQISREQLYGQHA